MIASCGYEIKFHDWESSSCIAFYKPPSDKKILFQDLSWSDSGKLLVAVPVTGRASIITPHQSVIFRNDPVIHDRDIINVSSVKSACFARTETNHLALGTSIGHLLHYNVASKYVKVLVDDLPASVNFIDYGAEDAYMAVGCGNGQIFILRENISITESYFVPHSDRITALVTHPNVPHYLAGGSDKGVIAIWDLNTSNYAMQVSPSNSFVLDIAFSPNDETFISIYQDQRIVIFDRRSCSCVHEKKFDMKLTALAYSPDGNEIAIGSDRGYILSMDKRYLRSLRSGIKAHESSIKKMKFQREYSNLFNPPDSEDCLLTSLRRSLTTEQEKIPFELTFEPCSSADGSKQEKILDPAPSSTMDQRDHHEKASTTSPSQASEISTYHIINEKSLMELRQIVMQTTEDLIEKVTDQINNNFLKMRMNVSREFCAMELRNRDRWQEFNDALLKIACVDDRSLNEDLRIMQRRIHETAVKDTTGEGDTDANVGQDYYADRRATSELMRLEKTEDTETDDIVHLDHEISSSKDVKLSTGNLKRERKAKFTSRLPKQRTYSGSGRRSTIFDSDD